MGRMVFKKAIITLGLGLTFASQSAMAGPLWNKLHADYNMKPNDHAYCFTAENGELLGVNAHRKARLASVTKVLTAFWAVSEMTSKGRYETTFYLKDKSLHIKGSVDPVMSKRKLFFLLSQLNNLGVEELEEITFDSKFVAYAGAEEYVGSVVKMSSDRIAKTVFDYWHTPEWKLLLPVYRDFVSSTPNSILEELQIRKNISDLDMKVGTVKAGSPSFDLKDESVKVFTHRSVEVAQYLKEMNIVSNNYIADQVYEGLGGDKEFQNFVKKFMNKHFPNYDKTRTGFSQGEASIRLYTGSGLPSEENGKRVDNYATCAIVVKMIEEFQNIIEDESRALSDVVAVPGSDGGTFKSRLRSERTKNTMVAKTGSLMHTSALAGMIRAKNNTSYFGIFHHASNGQANARIIQNKVVEALVEQYGGAKKFNYSPKYFFPADETLR